MKKHSKLYLILAFLGIMLVGCTTVKEIPIEIVKTEYKDKWHFDSIYLKENVYVYQKGDTIYKDSIVTKYIEKQVHDTVATHDTIPKIVYQDKIVEKKVPQWWPVYLTGGIVLLILGVYLVIKFKLFDKLHK